MWAGNSLDRFRKRGIHIIMQNVNAGTSHIHQLTRAELEKEIAHTKHFLNRLRAQHRRVLRLEAKNSGVTPTPLLKSEYSARNVKGK